MEKGKEFYYACSKLEAVVWEKFKRKDATFKLLLLSIILFFTVESLKPKY